MIIEQLKKVFDDMPAHQQVKYRRIFAKHWQFLMEQQEEAEDTDYYRNPHATTFTRECVRQRAFDAKGVRTEETVSPWTQANFFAGQMSETRIKAWMEIAGIEDISQDGYPLEGWDIGGQIVVHPDAVINLDADQRTAVAAEYGIHPGSTVAVEIKSINQNGWFTWTQQGAQYARTSYYYQAQLEMFGTQTHTCVLLVENKNTHQLIEEWVQRDQAVIDDLTRDYKAIMRADSWKEFERVDWDKAVRISRAKKPPKDWDLDKTEEYWSKGKKVGWQLFLSWMVPRWPCGYCQWREPCLADLDIEIVYNSSSRKQEQWIRQEKGK